nr:retrotransposon protein, putative, Ty1-copia subclass [Tanacetum cinerariifolium]
MGLQGNGLALQAKAMGLPCKLRQMDIEEVKFTCIARIASVAIIDHQLPLEYTIASRSTDVMVMANPVQNINHSAFSSMFERQKLSGNNFNDWFCQLKLILRVEKKMHVIKQPIPPAPAADSAANVLAKYNAVYDARNEVACLMLEKERKSISQYVLKMKGYVEQLECLGYVLQQDLSVGLILNGLTSDFAGFVRNYNYNMHYMGKTSGELHALLIEYEKGLPKKAVTPQVMVIQGGRIQKANKKSQNAKGKGKGKGMGKDKSNIPKPKHRKPNAKESPIKNDACHHCKEGLRGARKLKQGDLYLYVGNDVRAQVEAIGSFDLVLSNGLVIWLDNFHYAPSITRGVVSVSRLVENRSVQCFRDFGISVSRNNVLYFNAIPSNGIYEIDMSNPVPNVNSIYNVSNKRVKHNLDFTYLWHYCLAHISKKRIEKLKQDRLLKSTDDESFDQCVSCLSGKMTRKSFSHRHEMGTGVLGLIHTDVCGPLRHVSRQSASYFTTFTDDYSRYGYIYLLKHKHKLTPPYTPQHNGVFERRNHTFLDMVRSMMNLTTLPLSFWDYALEAVARILNMVPTKKIDKTQYELWFEKKSVGGGDLEEIQDEDTSPSEITSEISMEVEGFKPPQEEEAPVRLSEWPHRAPDRLCINVEVEEHSLGDLNEPANSKAAMLDPESTKWLDAMNAKMQSMKDNQVWRLVDLPPNGKTVGSKWLFKKKTDMDGNIHTYKARLVAKGFTQTYEVDYEEMFSLVAEIRAIRILIVIAVFYDYEIWQMDVKTAFLNSYLDEDIYMVQPEGFIDPKHPRKVCKLQRFIYGLKQASKSWNKIFDEKIKKFGFTQNLDEPCVYQKAGGSNVTFLILYVDDIVIMRNHIPSLQSVKTYLGKCFAMKDLEETALFLE